MSETRHPLGVCHTVVVVSAPPSQGANQVISLPKTLKETIIYKLYSLKVVHHY